MNFHPKSITMKWMQSNESADEDAVRLLDNLFESNTTAILVLIAILYQFPN